MQPLPPSPSASASLLPPTAPPPAPPSEEPKSPDGSDGRFASLVAQASQTPTPPPPPPKQEKEEERPCAPEAVANTSGTDSKAPETTQTTGSTPPQKPAKPAAESASEPAAKVGPPIQLTASQVVAIAPESVSLPTSSTAPSATQPSEGIVRPTAGLPTSLPKIEATPSPAVEGRLAPPVTGAIPTPGSQASAKGVPPSAVPAAKAIPTEQTKEAGKATETILPPVPPSSEPAEEAPALRPLTPAANAPKIWAQVQAPVEVSAPVETSSPRLAGPLPAPSSIDAKSAAVHPEDVRPALRIEAPVRLRENAATEVEPARPTTPRDAVKEAPASHDANLSLEAQKAAPRTEVKGATSPLPTPSLSAPTAASAKIEGAVLPPAPNAATPQLEAGVKWMLRTGTQEAQLQLHPESLGQVSIHLKVEGSSVHAKVWVAEAGSVQALQDGKAHLELSLRQQGLQLGSFDLQQGRQPAQRGFEAPASSAAASVSAAPPGPEPALAPSAPPPTRRLELIA